MSRCPRPLAAVLALLCLAAPALLAQQPGGRAARRPRAILIGDQGVLERGLTTPVQGPWRGFPISLSLRDAPLPDVLRAFAQIAHFNLVLDPRIPPQNVTVELRDVPWDQALHVILKTHGLAAEVDGRLWQLSAEANLDKPPLLDSSMP